MKIRNFSKGLLYSTKDSLLRFPITLVISLLFFVSLVILNESIGINSDLMSRISMIIGLALPVSMFVHLINESYVRANKGRILTFILGGVFLLLYYFIFLGNLTSVSVARYIGVLVFFIMGCTYVQKLIKNNNFEKHIISIINSFFLTGIYSAVLYLGIVFIIFTLEHLFNLPIIESIYYYVFLGVVFIFGMSMFLSKYPRKDFKDLSYPKALRVLLLYIVIPLISIYTLILIAYFIQIIITWQWPTGLVSHLVIWYSTISVFVIFFILPLLEENKVAGKFRRFFPMINIPILVMMFLSMAQRIVQYGFTENRYYILLLGIWILLIMLHFITRKPSSSTFIMVSLSVFILISVIGPLSSFNISIRSQNNRLAELLEKNSILENGQLTPNEGVLYEQQREISNILAYFNGNHSLSDVEILPDGYNLNEMEDDFGFEFTPDYSVQSYYFYYDLAKFEAIDIRNYDYYIPINSWGEDNRFSLSDLEIHFSNYNYLLTISDDNEKISYDIKEYVKYIHGKIGSNFYDSDDMTIIIESDYNLKLVFNHISGSEVSNGNDIDLQGLEFILLLDYNK